MFFALNNPPNIFISVDTSRCRKDLCSVNMFRSSTGSFFPERFRCSSGPLGVDTGPGANQSAIYSNVQTNSTGSCCPDTSRCRSGPCFAYMSNCSTCLFNVDKSRSSTGYCNLNTSRCSSGP
jgi:hypothetical protein